MDRQILKHVELAGFQANARRAGCQCAIRYGHFYAVDDGEIVVTGANVAVGKMDVFAAEAVESIIVGNQRVVHDVKATHHRTLHSGLAQTY